MRFSLLFLVCFFVYVAKCSGNFNFAPTPSLPLNNFYSKENIYPIKHQIEISKDNILQVFILAFGFFSLTCLSYLQLCNHVRYVTFNTNLSTCKGKTAKSPVCFWSYLYFLMLGLLFCECPEYLFLMFIVPANPNYGSVINLTLNFIKIVSQTIFSILSIYIFSIALWLPTILIYWQMIFIWILDLAFKITLISCHGM